MEFSGDAERHLMAAEKLINVLRPLQHVLSHIFYKAEYIAEIV